MLHKNTIAAPSALAVVIALAAASGCASSPPGPGTAPSPSQPPTSTGPATVSPPSAASPTATATTTTTATPGAPNATTVPSPRPTSPGTLPTVPTVRTVSSRVAYAWCWPNAAGGARVNHTYSVPPVPELVRIGVGDHPSDQGERPFNRISFTFTTAFPSYRFEFVSELTADPSGKPVPLVGPDVLGIVFTQAQAHTVDGARSSIASQPARPLHLARMVDYAQAGDFEGVLSYGVGVARPILYSNPQFAVRAYEVETVTASGQHLYTVALDIDATK